MTATTRLPEVARTAEAEQLLRDAAFVLKVTRKVKAEILRDAASVKDAIRPTERPAATFAA
jgi:hypothetical protein